MKAQGLKPAFPENPLPYITDWLFEIGPGVNSGNGMVEISWPVLMDWQRVMGIELRPWEAKLLRRLSRDFVSQWQDSKDPDCPPPYETKARISANRDRVENKARGLLSSMASAPQRKGMVKPKGTR